MKITHLKLANSVRAGRNEESFLTGEKFDMALQDGIFIKIIERASGRTVTTSVMNMIYMETDTDSPKETVPRGTNGRRSVNA